MKELLKNNDIHSEEDTVLVSFTDKVFASWCNNFLTADLDSFMNNFRLNITNEYYLKRWFSGYIQKIAAPIRVKFNTEEITKIKENGYSCRVNFYITYAVHKSEEVCFQLKFYVDDKQIIFSSVNIIHINQQWVLDDSLSVVDDVTLKVMQPIHSQSRWQMNEIKEDNDPERAALYARAALKSVRYRNTHAEIDCASILSNMMSYRVAELAYQCMGSDEETIVKKVNLFMKKVFDAKTYEELKEDDISYFPARELSLLALSDYDEMIYNAVRLNKNEVSCVDLCSFYISILRISGFRAEQAFLITQPFHYLAAVKLKDKFLIISLNEVITMSSDSLYGDTDLERVITPVFYAQNNGETNMPAEFFEEMKALLKKEIQVFSEINISESQSEVPAEAEEFPTISDYDSVSEFHDAIKKYVFDHSRKYPDSPFTWAKYSYQTLMVSKPQAYLIASINSVELKHFLKKYGNYSLVSEWLKEQCGIESVYLEEDRIMTAGQVIRNETGGHKDRAVFLYAALKSLKVFEMGLLCIGKHSSYVVFIDLDSNNKKIINASDCSICSRIPEDNLLILNEKEKLENIDIESFNERG